jgi:hypothetical protein
VALNEIPRECACIVRDWSALALGLAPVPSGMLTRRSVSVHYDGLPGMKDEILHDEVYELLVPRAGT